jgi:hypothetical protein
MGAEQRKQSVGCFSCLSFSKQTRSAQVPVEDDKKTKPQVVNRAHEDTRQNFLETRSATGNSESRVRLSRESGRSRASSSELQKRVSFSENANPSKSFSNMSSLKATGARKYPSRLDLQDEDLPSSLPSDGMMKISGPFYGSSNQSIGSSNSDRDTKFTDDSAHNLVEDVVDKLAKSIHSTLFPPPPPPPEPRYLMRGKSLHDEDLYLL